MTYPASLRGDAEGDERGKGRLRRAILPGHSQTEDGLINEADSAMYRAKAAGKNCYVMCQRRGKGSRPNLRIASVESPPLLPVARLK